MKNIDTAKTENTRKPGAFESSDSHDQTAAAFLARIYKVGEMSDRSALYEWGQQTVHLPSMGGVAIGHHRQWVDGQVEKLGEIEEAHRFITEHGEKLDKELPARREEAQANVESLEQTIAELQAALGQARAEVVQVDAEQSDLHTKREIVAQVEDDRAGLGVIGWAWRFVKTGKHPFESSKK